VEAATADESVLGLAHQIIESWGEAQGKHLGKDLGHKVKKSS
jgi:hypothetical protein